MHCEQAEMLLAQMAFGELKGEQEAALAAHLGECPRCSQALADMRSAAGLLTEAVQSGKAPALSPERRARLLRAFAASQEQDKARKAGKATKAPVGRSKKAAFAFPTLSRRLSMRLVGALAAVAVIAIVAGIFVPGLSRVHYSRQGVRHPGVEMDADGWKAAQDCRGTPSLAPQESDEAPNEGGAWGTPAADDDGETDATWQRAPEMDDAVSRPLDQERTIEMGAPEMEMPAHWDVGAAPTPKIDAVREANGTLGKLTRSTGGGHQAASGKPDLSAGEQAGAYVTEGYALGDKKNLDADTRHTAKGAEEGSAAVAGARILNQPAPEEEAPLGIGKLALGDKAASGEFHGVYEARGGKGRRKSLLRFGRDEAAQIDVGAGVTDDSGSVVGGQTVTDEAGEARLSVTGGDRKAEGLDVAGTAEREGAARPGPASATARTASSGPEPPGAARGITAPSESEGRIPALGGTGGKKTESAALEAPDGGPLQSPQGKPGGNADEYSLADALEGAEKLREEGRTKIARDGPPPPPKPALRASAEGTPPGKTAPQGPAEPRKANVLDMVIVRNKLGGKESTPKSTEAVAESTRRDETVTEELGRSVVDSYRQSGEEYFDNLDYDQAKAEFEKVLKADPDNREAKEYLRKTETILGLRQERFANIIDQLSVTKHVEIEPVGHEMEVALEKGKKLLAEGKHEEAAERFARVKELAEWVEPCVEGDKLAEAQIAQLKSQIKAYYLVADGKKKLADGKGDARPAFIRVSPVEAARMKEDSTAVREQEGRVSKEAEESPEAATDTEHPEVVKELPAAEDETERVPVFRAVPVNPFVMTEKDRFSTFSIDVDTASYSLARNYIRRGYLPPAASVRMEEFINAFDYNYPKLAPGGQKASDVFAVHAEAMPSPFGRGLTLLKIGVQGKVLGREGRKPAHLVFVVDASGSMARADRMPLVQDALTLLTDQLGPADRVSLVAYSTEAGLVLEGAAASNRQQIIEAIDATQCGGSTNLLAGLELGYSLARRHFRAGEINRVILCSDGVANVGLVDAEDMLEKVATYKEHGITFTSVGFGMGSYNDELLEKLANKGDGTYMFVDSHREARRVFVEEMAATLQTIAKDVKIQVELDPRRVRRYRLIGYENRDIADEDFRNDAVDAGEVGSGQSATALYELELLQYDDGCWTAPNLGTVYVRYRNVDTGKVEEISSRLDNSLIKQYAPEGAPRLFLAAAAAEFAEILRQSEHATDTSLDAVRRIVEQVAVRLPLDQKVQELLWLVKRAKGLPPAR